MNAALSESKPFCCIQEGDTSNASHASCSTGTKKTSARASVAAAARPANGRAAGFRVATGTLPFPAPASSSRSLGSLRAAEQCWVPQAQRQVLLYRPFASVPGVTLAVEQLWYQCKPVSAPRTPAPYSHGMPAGPAPAQLQQSWLRPCQERRRWQKEGQPPRGLRRAAPTRLCCRNPQRGADPPDAGHGAAPAEGRARGFAGSRGRSPSNLAGTRSAPRGQRYRARSRHKIK